MIIGNGEEKKNLSELIKSKNFSNHIKILERTENVHQFMINSQAFILSSLWEEVGFVIVEAALSNCLIISSNCPNGPSEFLDYGKGGLLYQSNKNGELSKNIKKFMTMDNNDKLKMKISCKKIFKVHNV